MNKTTKILAFVLVMVMCIGLFTACGGDTGSTEGTTPSGTTPTGTTAPAVELDIVGVVMEVSDTFVKLDLCQSSAQGLPYNKQDVSTLEGTGEVDYVYLNSGALFAHYTDGTLNELKKADLSAGDIIVVTKTEKGVQQIVVLNYSAETPSEPTDPTEATGSGATE